MMRMNPMQLMNAFRNAKNPQALLQQVMQYAKQVGVDMQQFGDATFCLAMNMMYSDYCGVAKKFGFDRPEVYADLAKAFLDDKDFDGEPEEKLYLYYKCIVEKE